MFTPDDKVVIFALCVDKGRGAQEMMREFSGVL